MNSPQTEMSPPQLGGRLQRSIEWLALRTDSIARSLLLILLAIVLGTVLTRNVFRLSLVWLDDLARYLLLWVIYTGAVTVTMRGEHITMDAAYLRMPTSWKLMVRRVVGVVSLTFCAITGYLGLQQAIEVVRIGEVSVTGVFPAIIGYACLPFGFGVMGAASLYYLFYISPRDNVVSSS